MAPALPVDRSRSQIVDAVFENRVSLVLGSTGCGKSSRVPQFLLEDLGGPVLCTQPRRLAVVSIAKRVAEERGVPLGGDEVGYRIGQRPHYSSRTAIVFATAGVLLEDLKAQGAGALTRYKVIVLDEVHERSVESDLVLACVREFMRENRRVKLVLMSATCDVEAYSAFFKQVSDGRLARIQITDMSLNLTNLLKSTTVRYMEDAIKLLGGQEDAAGLPLPLSLGGTKPRVAGLAPEAPTPGRTLDWPASGSAASLAPSDEEGGGAAGSARGPVVGPAAMLEYRSMLDEAKAAPSKVEGAISAADQRLLRDLVCALHRQDPDLGNAVMVFLPTYRTLELQHELLLATGLPFAVFALHSSIALDECIAAMELAAGGRRKVVLATNIAESSITIRGIRYVVDCCRTLQLRWDRQTKRTQSSIIYASRSQCDQRKGRTGRTCDGVVYRLLPRRVFLEHLPQFEAPHLTLLHLRRETLGLLCAASPLMSNPLALLRRCMTPPEGEVPADALLYLSSAGAASPAPGSACGFQPTPLGRLLGGLPVSIEAAQLLAGGGKAGLLRPAAVLAALCCTTPYPIFQPFASAEQYRQNLRRYGGPEVSPGDAQSVLLANLAAFLFWEHAWRDRQRMQQLQQLAAGAGTAGGVEQGAEPSGKASSSDGSGGGSSSGGGGGSGKPEEGGGGNRSGGTLPDADAEEQAWCLQHALIRSSLHSVAETADVLMQVLHQHRPNFLLDPANCGPPPHFTAPASGGVRGGSCGAGLACGGAVRHACRLGPAPRQWGADAYGAATEQCVAGYARLEAFFSQQDIQRLGQLVLSKDVEPASLAAGSGSAGLVGFGQRWEDALEYASFRLRPTRRAREVCRFFLTPKGCAYGLDCRFSHDAAVALSPDMLAALRRPVTFPGSAGGEGGLLPPADSAARLFDFGAGDTVLLLGEGDLSFTEALLGCSRLSGHGAPRLVASTQLGRRQLLEAYPASSCAARLARLEAAAAAGEHAAGSARLRLLFGVCATQLHLLGEPGSPAAQAGAGAAAAATGSSAGSTPGGSSSNGGGSVSGGPPFRLADATHVVFNFPHTGVDEDDEGHCRLLADFFASAGAALLAQGGSAQVLLTLCNDQFSRWHAEAAGRAAFFFLEESAAFSGAAFPGYSPQRGQGDEGFPLARPLTYRFSFCPPVL
ncbi:hypothetical protein ABPG75_011501 [Micractinium tetrahymenae]